MPTRASTGQPSPAHPEAAVSDPARRRGLDDTVHLVQRPPSRERNTVSTGQAGYRVSQVIRKRIEEAFGWMKSAAGLRKTRHRGVGRVGWQFTFTLAAYILIRLPKLLAAAA